MTSPMTHMKSKAKSFMLLMTAPVTGMFIYPHVNEVRLEISETEGTSNKAK